MPYIKQQHRDRLDHGMTVGDIPENAGELNYVLSQVLIDFVMYHGLSYQVINDIVGALDGCKAEFHDRIIRPYEDLKIRENGDVYQRILPV